MKKLFLTVAVLALFATPALADRSIEGSYVELIEPQGLLCACSTYEFVFYVWNNSMDVEWIAEIIITFPDCWEIVAGSDWYTPDPGAAGPFNFMFIGGGNVAHWADADGGWGEIYGGEGGHFGVTVHICPDMVGDVPIYWGLQGDIYGNEPHYVDGEIWVIVSDTTPVEDSTWSKVKGLY